MAKSVSVKKKNSELVIADPIVVKLGQAETARSWL